MKVIFTANKVITPSKEFIGKEHELAAKLDIQEYQIIDVGDVPVIPNDEDIQEIARLESLITPRRLREAVLTESGAAWLVNIEAQISVERNKLTNEGE